MYKNIEESIRKLHGVPPSQTICFDWYDGPIDAICKFDSIDNWLYLKTYSYYSSDSMRKYDVSLIDNCLANHLYSKISLLETPLYPVWCPYESLLLKEIEAITNDLTSKSIKTNLVLYIDLDNGFCVI